MDNITSPIFCTCIYSTCTISCICTSSGTCTFQVPPQVHLLFNQGCHLLIPPPSLFALKFHSSPPHTPIALFIKHSFRSFHTSLTSPGSFSNITGHGSSLFIVYLLINLFLVPLIQQWPVAKLNIVQVHVRTKFIQKQSSGYYRISKIGKICFKTVWCW